MIVRRELKERDIHTGPFDESPLTRPSCNEDKGASFKPLSGSFRIRLDCRVEASGTLRGAKQERLTRLLRSVSIL